MFRNEKLEMKVGLFIGAGIFLMFLMVFSVSDMHFFDDGYHVYSKFSFVSGLTPSAPVRYAGVRVGEIKSVELLSPETTDQVQVQVKAWIRSGTEIDKHSVGRINSLGLLGEHYLEIIPGNSGEMLSGGESLKSVDPINMAKQMEDVREVVVSVSDLLQFINKGEGTIGRLVTEDDMYNTLHDILVSIREGHGTLGKLLVEDELYNTLQEILLSIREGDGTLGKLLVEDGVHQEIEELVAHIRRHPWRLLQRPSREERREAEEEARGTVISPKN